MRTYSMPDLPDDCYRRFGTVQRTMTLAPLVPSQDVSRYQARDMPPPTYDLDRKESRAFMRGILVPTLAVVATGGGIMLIQRIGIWLTP